MQASTASRAGLNIRQWYPGTRLTRDGIELPVQPALRDGPRSAEWKRQLGAAARCRCAVLQRQGSAVRLGNLAAEHEADARSSRLRGEERDEQVRRVREPW